MNDLSYQDVLNILRLIDTAGFSHLELEFEGTRIKAVRRTGTPARAGLAGDVPPSFALRDDKPVSALQTAGPDKAAPSPALPDAELGSGEIAVRPPMEGTFYASSAPGRPPFAAVGQHIRKGDQVGIVEVMKLFTPVLAPCDGTVLKILVANEQVVAKDQMLMVMATDGGAAS